MKKAVILGVLVVSSAFAMPFKSGTTKAWSTCTEGERITYVAGITDAYTAAGGHGLPQHSFSIGMILSAMDMIYGDPLNAGIDSIRIYQAAVMVLNGAPDIYVQVELHGAPVVTPGN